MMPSSETTGSIDCPECSLSFDSREELVRHSKTHKAEREDDGNLAGLRQRRDDLGRSEMPSIEERVVSRSEEKGKGKTPAKNFKQPSHACRDCGQFFASLSDLTNHYKQAHPESM